MISRKVYDFRISIENITHLTVSLSDCQKNRGWLKINKTLNDITTISCYLNVQISLPCLTKDDS